MSRIHKGFKHGRSIPPALLPVITDTSGRMTQCVARQVLYLHPGKHQKAAIVDHETKVPQSLIFAPADPAVTLPQAFSRARKQQTPQQTAFAGDAVKSGRLSATLCDICFSGSVTNPCASSLSRSLTQASCFKDPVALRHSRCSLIVSASSVRLRREQMATVSQISASSSVVITRPQCTKLSLGFSRPIAFAPA